MMRRLAAVLVALTVAGCGSGGSGGGQPTTTTLTASMVPTSTAAPSATPDPAAGIEGIVIVAYRGGVHVTAPQRVAYDRFPPFGGAHDALWAPCNGVVYRAPVRNEHMVHSLEHGAVWIAYDPARVGGTALATLERLVTGQPYLMLSPYPSLPRPISLQSWSHQLQLDDPADPRLVRFIRILRANPNTSPEPGASCDAVPGAFDVANPPPLDPSPPGPGAAPVG